MNLGGGGNVTLSINSEVEEQGLGVCGGRQVDIRKQLVLWNAGR